MKPYIFIASSVEGLHVAEALQLGLQYAARCTVWSQAFPLSNTTIDTLIDNCIANDFAIFVFSPDDKVTIRREDLVAARDNVIFETGLFAGMHGKRRAFIVLPHDVPELHIPTDLLALTTAKYESAWAKKSPNAALGAAVAEIKQAISSSEWAKEKPDVRAWASFRDTATYPLKLNFEIGNHHSVRVVLESEVFDFHPSVPLAENARRTLGKYVPLFHVGTNAKGVDQYLNVAVVEPKGAIRGWIPINPSFGEAKLSEALKKREAGCWSFKQTLLEVTPRTSKIAHDF